MDNILKLLLGVLGVSGMIAMVTSNLSFEPTAGTNSNAVEPPIIMQPVEETIDDEEALPEDELEESPEEDGDDIFAVGEPMIDGNPYGSNAQQQSPDNGAIPVDMAQAGNFNPGGGVPQSYDQQQIFTPAPAQDNYNSAIAEGQ